MASLLDGQGEWGVIYSSTRSTVAPVIPGYSSQCCTSSDGPHFWQMELKTLLHIAALQTVTVTGVTYLFSTAWPNMFASFALHAALRISFSQKVRGMYLPSEPSSC